uniref:C2H2-type domain-containing protein n=1 Tax=Neogobius melanostomus TaxID=47308 RepID=A0A8C6SLM2_9GOBI
MPSAIGQNMSTMEKQKVVGEQSTFICTVCGDGFSQYQHVLSHMSVHGPLDSFAFDGSSNGFEVPREYVLQDNGTLTVLSGMIQSEYSKRPSSPGILPSHLSCQINSFSPFLKQQSSSRDVLASKPLDSNFDNSHGHVYSCEVCSRTFNNLQYLHRHQQYRNEGGYRCTLCCKLFKGRPELKKHFQNHTFESFQWCASCGKRFVKADALKIHMTQNHSSKRSHGVSENNQEFKLERTYTCKKCKLTFFWLTDFQTHSFYLCKGKKVHETDSTYRCGLCGEQFSELTALKEHHSTHQQKTENPTENTVKPKPFKNVIPKENCGIRKNLFNVKKLKMYPCKLCRCVFQHSSSLSRHMSYHKGSTCELCGKLFQQQSDVIKHLMFHKTEMKKQQNANQAFFHDNEKPSPGELKGACGNYKCLECGKKFGLLCVYRMCNYNARLTLHCLVYPQCEKRKFGTKACIKSVNLPFFFFFR